MARILALLLFCVFLVACNKKSKEESSCSSNCGVTHSKPSTSEVPSIGTELPSENTSKPGTGGGGTSGETPTEPNRLPTEAYTFDANISFYNVSRTQEAKFLKAIDLIKQVVATEEFRSRIINHSYGGKKTFVDNGGYTNYEIYRKILYGAETLQRSMDNEMDMEVQLYTAFNSTVGYTYPSSKRIWVNTKYFNVYNAAQVARNLFHEWLHKLGFKHAVSYSTSRRYSVPYAIGDIVEDIGKDFL